MVNPLAENWQHLLGIFWKLSFQWWKRRQIRSWIAFGKRYQSSSHITHKKWIKVCSVSHINKGGGVDTQQLYQWSGKGRDCYIWWFSQQRGSMPILKDWYLPMRECMKIIADFSWWEWDTGSSLFFWKWPQLYQAWAWEGQPHYEIYNFPKFLLPQDTAKTEEDRSNMKNKVVKVRKRLYIEPDTVLNLTHMFYVRKGLNDIRMVYNGTSWGIK